jgi:hypothetical protein
MSEEKRAYSWRQFVESGFDGRDYKFPTFEGTYTATIACKRWDKHNNVIAYLDFDDGRKTLTSAWQSEQYHGLPDMPFGSRVRVTFGKSANGKFYLRGVEEI